MKFRYTTTTYSFIEPGPIREYDYINLKRKLHSDINFSLLNPNEKITNKFNLLLKELLGILINAVILLSLIPIGYPQLMELFIDNYEHSKYAECPFVMILFGISMLWTTFGSIYFLINLEDISSYASYLKKKRRYFTKMESYIIRSGNYEDFYERFYKQIS